MRLWSYEPHFNLKLGIVHALNLFHRALESEYYHTNEKSKFVKFLESISSVQALSLVRLFATPWITARQASLSITNSWSSLRLTSIESVMPSSHLILSCPLLLLPPIPPASESFPMSQLFPWGGQSIGVSASISVLPMNIQHWFPLGWTGLISYSSRDSQESSPTPQFKSINSSLLSFLHSPTLTSIYDHWKNHSLD